MDIAGQSRARVDLRAGFVGDRAWRWLAGPVEAVRLDNGSTDGLEELDVVVIAARSDDDTVSPQAALDEARVKGVRTVVVGSANDDDSWCADADLWLGGRGLPSLPPVPAAVTPVERRWDPDPRAAIVLHQALDKAALGVVEDLRKRAPVGAVDVVSVVDQPPELAQQLEVRRESGAPEQVLRWLQPYRLVLDHPDLHRSPWTRTTWLTTVAAGGVAVSVGKLAPSERQLLGLLAPALEHVDPQDLDDLDAIGLHSVEARRRALSCHDVMARWQLVAELLDLPLPAPRSVTGVLVTNRPDFLEFAAEQVAAIDQAAFDVVLGLHGHGFPDGAAERFAKAQRNPVTVLRLPESLSFGSALNEACAAGEGELLTKIDDDDWYGPKHVQDLVLAWATSGADLVAKGAEFVHLDELDLTIRRYRKGGDSSSRTVAGGTLLFGRDALERAGGFRDVPRTVDQFLIDDVLASGGTIHRTHGYGYVLRRHGHGHTWESDADYFLRHSDSQYRGLRLDVAGVAWRPPRSGHGS
ncbi:MAG: glycosyltransferase [Nitriliruptorales bacterium]|nr:glycosyltransferase [Nitriliruptorales bacterium]